MIKQETKLKYVCTKTVSYDNVKGEMRQQIIKVSKVTVSLNDITLETRKATIDLEDNKTVFYDLYSWNYTRNIQKKAICRNNEREGA